MTTRESFGAEQFAQQLIALDQQRADAKARARVKKEDREFDGQSVQVHKEEWEIDPETFVKMESVNTQDLHNRSSASTDPKDEDMSESKDIKSEGTESASDDGKGSRDDHLAKGLTDIAKVLTTLQNTMVNQQRQMKRDRQRFRGATRQMMQGKNASWLPEILTRRKRLR